MSLAELCFITEDMPLKGEYSIFQQALVIYQMVFRNLWKLNSASFLKLILNI